MRGDHQEEESPGRSETPTQTQNPKRRVANGPTERVKARGREDTVEQLPVSSVPSCVREYVSLRPADLAGVLVDLGTVGDAVPQPAAESAASQAISVLRACNAQFFF